jgi:hypothetical protein
LTGARRVARERESRTIRYISLGSVVRLGVQWVPTGTRVEALAWARLSAQGVLIPGLVQTGKECTSTSSTFAESGYALAAHGQMKIHVSGSILAFSSRYCRVKFGPARKGFRPLRQLHWLRRFLSTYCRQPVRAPSGLLQGHPKFAF